MPSNRATKRDKERRSGEKKIREENRKQRKAEKRLRKEERRKKAIFGHGST